MLKGKEPMASASPEGSATSIGSPAAPRALQESDELAPDVCKGGGKSLGRLKYGPQEKGLCDLFLTSPSENHCVSIPNGVETASHMSPEPYEGRDAPVKGGGGRGVPPSA